MALFFLAFLPQFSDPARGSLTLRCSPSASSSIAQTVLIFGGMALAAGSVGGLPTPKPCLGPGSRPPVRLLFIGPALRLAADDE